MIKETYHSDRAFLDLLFNCLLGFVYLFVISFLMVEVEKKKANITTKAEYVITLTWDLNNIDDIDTWLRDPAGNLLFFRRKNVGLMHLDRDDRGNIRDSYTLPDGTTIYYPYNQEIVTIRGFIPGQWILNIHMYYKRDAKPANVEVKLEKLNPSVKTIFIKRYEIKNPGEQITVARFEMSSTGDITNIDEVPVRLIEQELTSDEMMRGHR